MSTDITLFVEGQTFVADLSTRKFRMKDVQFATWVGYQNPASIRKIIVRYKDNEIFQKLPMESSVEFIEKTGAIRGVEKRVVQHYMLSEEQMLFIASKSDTERANALLVHMINVFCRVHREMDAALAVPVANPITMVPVVDSARLMESMSVQIGTDVVRAAHYRALIKATAGKLNVTFQRIEGYLCTNLGLRSYLLCGGPMWEDLRRVLWHLESGVLKLPKIRHRKRKLKLVDSRQLTIPGLLLEEVKEGGER